MSIINNASPGSQIRLICLIDRVLNRRRKKKLITRQELIEICRPENLVSKESSVKRFPENLDFWLSEGLWKQEGERIGCKDKDASEENLYSRVLSLIISGSKDQNILEGKRIEPLIRSITVLLAQDQFAFQGQFRDGVNLSKPSDIANTINHRLPEFSINETNDANTLKDWGIFLGFLEPLAGGVIVDPTKAIKSFLPTIFAETKELSIREFVAAVSNRLPMLDTGTFRQVIESKMEETGWQPHLENYVSASLSHALLRLKMGMQITLEQPSDDRHSVKLKTPNGSELSVGLVRYRRNV